jgi:hypothetical protein
MYRSIIGAIKKIGKKEHSPWKRKRISPEQNHKIGLRNQDSWFVKTKVENAQSKTRRP